jgi:hypothetical protein
MKQLLYLFLLLLPCFAWAQYPSNGNQKITLGEQTTADGLIYRGVLGDTLLITPSSDTSAYIILDTVNHRFYNYNRATNVWSMAGVGSISSGLTGVLPLANGGTGSATQNFVDLTNTQTVGGAKTFSSAATFNTNLVINKSVTSASPVPLVIFSADELYNHMRLTNKTGSNTIRRAGLSVQDYEGSNSVGLIGIFSGATDNGLNFGGGVSGLKLPTYINFYTGGYNLNGNNSTRKITSIDSLGRFKIGDINNYAAATEQLHVIGNGRFTANIAAGVTSATARVHLAQGTATASTAPLKFTSGTNLTTAEAGAMEFNGTNLFFSPSTTRHTVNHGLTGSATLNFPSTLTMLSADLTITVTGAADGDVVSLGIPNAAVNANTSYSAWVSAANTVTVRFNNYSIGTVDPASALFKVFVTK